MISSQLDMRPVSVSGFFCSERCQCNQHTDAVDSITLLPRRHEDPVQGDET